jgi:hypothetical protein
MNPYLASKKRLWIHNPVFQSRAVEFSELCRDGSDDGFGSKGDEQPCRPPRPPFLRKPTFRPPCKSQHFRNAQEPLIPQGCSGA